MENLYDLIVIGGGPSGLTAAIYMARARYKTLVLEKDKIGGQITMTNEVVNYPGILNTTGEELTKTMAIQAQNFGAEIKTDEVIDINLEGDIKEITTKTKKYRALSVIISTGATPRHLGFKGEDEYKGRGIAYCATCDGEFFEGKDIYVVGGGLAAAEEAMFLTRYGKSVTMIVREPELICSKAIIEKVKNHNPKINIYYNFEPYSVSGSPFVNELIIKNRNTEELITFKSNEDVIGVFLFSGYIPNTKLFEGKIDLDRGYVITNEKLETNIQGVYAVGDLRIKNLRQVVTATADGAIAATNAQTLVESLHEKLNIPDLYVNVKKEETKPISHEVNTSSNQFIDAEMIPQLQTVFSRINKKVSIIGNVNSSELSNEMKIMLNELKNVSSNIEIRFNEIESDKVAYIELECEEKKLPYRFNGVPGGHEFTSFILTIYHLVGPKKDVSNELLENISKINRNINIDVVVTLSCTKCPGLITAISQVMSYTDKLNLNVYDLNHFENIKEKYRIMSVPCLILDEKHIDFGQKNMEEIVKFILENI